MFAEKAVQKTKPTEACGRRAGERLQVGEAPVGKYLVCVRQMICVNSISNFDLANCLKLIFTHLKIKITPRLAKISVFFRLNKAKKALAAVSEKCSKCDTVVVRTNQAVSHVT